MKNVLAWAIIVSPIAALTLLLLWAAPQYGVYSQTLSGKAKLQEAEFSRQIQVLEAKAQLESAQLNLERRVTDAKAEVEAIAIVGASLEKAPDYIKLRYIQSLEETKNSGDRTVVYVPTQEGIPVLPVTEAGRLVESVVK